MTPGVAERAAGRASRPVTPGAVIDAARKAGALVAGSDADIAAGELLRALERGGKLSERLRRLLVNRLGSAPVLSDPARSAGAWAGASAAERGEALCDLLLLADALPAPRSERPRPAIRRRSAA